MAAQQFIFGAWVRASYIAVADGILMDVADLSGDSVISVSISSLGTSFSGNTVTASSFRVRVARNNGFGTSNHDVDNPFVDPLHGQDYTTYPCSSWTPHLWALRVKTSSVAASTDGEFELQIDGATVLSATGVAIFTNEPDDDFTAAVRTRGDIDNFWVTPGAAFPTLDGNGVPSSVTFFQGFDAGDTTGLVDWPTNTPYVRSDVGAGGGYGYSRWNSSPSLAYPSRGTAVSNAGFAHEFAPLVTIVGSAVFGVNTTVRATNAIAMGLDGATNVHDTAGEFRVFGDVHITGDLVVDGSSSAGGDLSDALDALGE